MNFTFDEKAHAYFLDGKPLIGCTTVLNVLAKPALIQWSANMAVKYVIEKGVPYYGENDDLVDNYIVTGEMLDEAKTAHRRKKEGAADVGTHVHLWLEQYITGLKPAIPEDPQEKKMIEAFLKWEEEVKPKWLASEKRVYALSTHTAGTLDFIAEINGKVYLGDFKTSSGIYNEMFWQTSAYQYMLQEMEPTRRIDGHIIVNIQKTGKIETRESFDYHTNIKAFLACLTMYKVQNGLPITDTILIRPSLREKPTFFKKLKALFT